MKKHKPIIEHTTLNDDKVVSYCAKKLVRKFGTSAHIPLPISLLGKVVTITYEEKK